MNDTSIDPRDINNNLKENNASFDPDVTIAGQRARKERGELQVGDVVLNRYELLEKLGSGAMGVVFKCRDQVSRVEYALKMVPPELARDATALEDVRENFQLIHGLKHPNIASADFLDRDENGSYFLIMEYAQGITLSQWIKRKWRAGHPELSEVVNIVQQIASALDYAHKKHVLHRDIKPTNIVVCSDGEVKVLDFGLASQVRSTMTAMSINLSNTSGTPNYLSPEQFKGRYPTPASDQYTLGVLTYQMLSGHLPFESEDNSVLRAAVLSEEAESIDGISPSVNQCLQKVLNKDPKMRYGDCSEFAKALSGEEEIPQQIIPEQISCERTQNGSSNNNQSVFSPEKATPQQENMNHSFCNNTLYSLRNLFKIALYHKILLFSFVGSSFCLLFHLIYCIVDSESVEFAFTVFFSPFFFFSFIMIVLLRIAEKKDDFCLSIIIAILAVLPLIVGLIDIATWGSRFCLFGSKPDPTLYNKMRIVLWHLSCIFGVIAPLYEIICSTKILKSESIRVKVFGVSLARLKELKKQSAIEKRNEQEGTGFNTKVFIVIIAVIFTLIITVVLTTA